MIVYNISKSAITYRKRLITPGGSFNFPDLKVVPARDQMLEKQKILSFGSLPTWYILQKQAPAKPVITAPKNAPMKSVEVRAVAANDTKEEAPKREQPQRK